MDIEVYLDRTIKHLESQRTLTCDIATILVLPPPMNRATWKATISFYDGSLLYMSQTVETGECLRIHSIYPIRITTWWMVIQSFVTMTVRVSHGLQTHKHIGGGSGQTIVAADHPSPGI